MSHFFGDWYAGAVMDGSGDICEWGLTLVRTGGEPFLYGLEGTDVTFSRSYGCVFSIRISPPDSFPVRGFFYGFVESLFGAPSTAFCEKNCISPQNMV